MFESHITVNDDKQNFFKICKENNLKPVLITNDSGSNQQEQLMTAKFHKTDSVEQALSEMHSISSLFTNVVRRKLEKIGKECENFKYQEVHSKFIVTQDLECFLSLVCENNSHYSINKLKDNNSIFVTSRDFDIHDKLINKLKQQYQYVGTIKEHVIYDDNETIDNNWNCMECPLKYIK